MVVKIWKSSILSILSIFSPKSCITMLLAIDELSIFCLESSIFCLELSIFLVEKDLKLIFDVSPLISP